jgi:ubiquinone biosynthesis protein
MGREIVDDFDILSQTLEIASEIIKAKYDPQRVLKDLAVVLKDSATLLKDLPKQLQSNLRKKNHGRPQLVTIAELKDVQRSVEVFSILVFLGMVIGSLILAGVMALDKQTANMIMDIPLTSAVCFLTAIFLGLIAFYNYIRR